MKKTLLLKLLATKKLKINNGLISLNDSYFNLLPTIFVSSLVEYFYSRDELYKLYLISWFWGYDAVNTVKTELGLEKPEKIYSIGMNFAESEGLGLYRTDDYYPGEYTKFKIKTNPYHRHMKLEKFNQPIDYFISGAMAGGGSHVHQAVCQNIETQCKVQGEKECEFITGTHDELRDRGLWNEAEKRYNLEKIIDFQEEVFNNYNKDKSEEFVEQLNKIITE